MKGTAAGQVEVNTMMGNEGIEINERIRTFLRIRPLQDRERGHGIAVGCESNTRVHVTDELKGNRWALDVDHVFKPGNNQDDVWRFVEPCIRRVVNGFTSTIFAHGHTGTGKTYTMFGPELIEDFGQTKFTRKTISANARAQLIEKKLASAEKNIDALLTSSKRGIIPRACEGIFQHINSIVGAGNPSVRVFASYVQIYNEKLIDLLADASNEDIPLTIIRSPHNPSASIIQGLQLFEVNSPTQLVRLLMKGTLKRAFRTTRRNKMSSRSHAIFQIEVRQYASLNDPTSYKQAKLNLVDLAGNERCDTCYSLDKVHLEEMGTINKSISNIILCIQQLAKEGTAVSYRSSVLTRLLQESLGGDCCSLLICTVSPSALCVRESISTLRLAIRAKTVRVSARAAESRTYGRDSRKLQKLILLQKKMMNNKEEAPKMWNGFVGKEHFLKETKVKSSNQSESNKIEVNFADEPNYISDLRQNILNDILKSGLRSSICLTNSGNVTDIVEMDIKQQNPSTYHICCTCAAEAYAFSGTGVVENKVHKPQETCCGQCASGSYDQTNSEKYGKRNTPTLLVQRAATAVESTPPEISSQQRGANGNLSTSANCTIVEAGGCIYCGSSDRMPDAMPEVYKEKEEQSIQPFEHKISSKSTSVICGNNDEIFRNDEINCLSFPKANDEERISSINIEVCKEDDSRLAKEARVTGFHSTSEESAGSLSESAANANDDLLLSCGNSVATSELNPQELQQKLENLQEKLRELEFQKQKETETQRHLSRQNQQQRNILHNLLKQQQLMQQKHMQILDHQRHRLLQLLRHQRKQKHQQLKQQQAPREERNLLKGEQLLQFQKLQRALKIGTLAMEEFEKIPKLDGQSDMSLINNSSSSEIPNCSACNIHTETIDFSHGLNGQSFNCRSNEFNIERKATASVSLKTPGEYRTRTRETINFGNNSTQDILNASTSGSRHPGSESLLLSQRPLDINNVGYLNELNDGGMCLNNWDYKPFRSSNLENRLQHSRTHIMPAGKEGNKCQNSKQAFTLLFLMSKISRNTEDSVGSITGTKLCRPGETHFQGDKTLVNILKPTPVCNMAVEDSELNSECNNIMINSEFFSNHLRSAELSNEQNQLEMCRKKYGVQQEMESNPRLHEPVYQSFISQSNGSSSNICNYSSSSTRFVPINSSNGTNSGSTLSPLPGATGVRTRPFNSVVPIADGDLMVPIHTPKTFQHKQTNLQYGLCFPPVHSLVQHPSVSSAQYHVPKKRDISSSAGTDLSVDANKPYRTIIHLRKSTTGSHCVQRGPSPHTPCATFSANVSGSHSQSTWNRNMQASPNWNVAVCPEVRSGSVGGVEHIQSNVLGCNIDLPTVPTQFNEFPRLTLPPVFQ